MIEITAYVGEEDENRISPLGTVRDWMDETWDKHAYHCFPVTLANRYGWGISFPEDISFIWDGINDSSANHVQILKGHKYASPSRGNATVSFHTGITIRTRKNINILSMPPANYFVRGAQPFTTIINSSFFNSELPCAWRITEPNLEITVKAGTPVISIVPIDLENLQNSEIKLENYNFLPDTGFNVSDYSAALTSKNQEGTWSDFYRNATDHEGNKIGEHSAKSIRLGVKGLNE